MEELTENQKLWFEELLTTEIGYERATVDNETEWETGSADGETRRVHRANAHEHSGYIRFLEGLKARHCGAA